MRKLVLLTEYYDRIGGISTFIKEYYKRIRNHYNTYLLTSDIKTTKQNIIKLPTSKSLKIIKTLVNLLKIKPNIIHVNGPWYYLLSAIVYKKIFLNTKIIQTIHTQPTKKLPIKKRKIYSYLLNSTNYVVSVSKNNISNIINNFGVAPNKIMTIYNGIPLMNFINKKCKKVSPYRILTVLNFENELKVKGVVILIKSLVDIPNVKLTIAGDGKFHDIINKEINKTQQQNKVEMIGMVTNISIELSKADIFCHISFQDSLPFSILEAMVYKIPIVASQIGGIPEILDEDYPYLTPNKSSEIAKRIKRIIKYGQFKYDYASHLKKFKWSNCISKYIALYEK